MIRRPRPGASRLARSAGLALPLMFGLAANAVAEHGPAADVPAIRPVVSVIVTSHGQQAATYYGQVAARVVTDLGFAQPGELQERPARRGDTVGAGELLAALDPSDLDARLRAAEAQYEVALAQAAQAGDAEVRIRELAARGHGQRSAA